MFRQQHERLRQEQEKRLALQRLFHAQLLRLVEEQDAAVSI